MDANGNSRNYAATDANHTMVTVKDPLNNVVYAYTVGFDGNMSGTTSTNGANVIQATNTFASANTPYKPSNVTDALNRTWNYTWDAYGNCLTSTTPRNTTTTNTYSYTNFALGRLTQVQEGSKTATNLTYYEPSGLPNTISSAKPGTVSTGQQVTTTYTWDALGNILTMVSPGNNATTTNTTTFNYTTDGSYSQTAALGQPLVVTDNLGHATHFRWDNQRRQTAVIDALGNESDTTYNLIGQPLQSIAPATGQTGSGHSYTQNAYQYVGGSLQSTTAYDESGVSIRQVTTAYGPEGEALTVTGSTEPVAYAYDALYRLKTLTDGNSHSTTYGYNATGYLSSVVYPGGDTFQYTSYDNLGNLLSRTDGRGVVTNYAYSDVEAKLTAVQYPASASLNVGLHYDSYGRPDTITDGTGSRASAYDDKSNPTSVSTTYTGLPAKSISYVYFPDGSLQTLTTPAGIFSYSFDAGGRVTGMTNPFSETFSWTYLNNDWLWTQTSGNAVKSTYTYNALGQVTRLLNAKLDTTTLSDFSAMTYDGAGNRKTMTSSLNGVPNYSGATSYNYDVKDQLTQESSTRIGGYTNNFGFDSAGNATNFKGATQTFNSNNQNTANSYDLNGNPTTYKTFSATFDVENRMTSYGSVMTAGYLAGGERAWKQTSSGRTYYLYADGVIPICELDASGNVIATNSIWSGGLLSRRTTSSAFYAFDLQGSASHRLDINGNTLSTSTFDAFGTRVTNDTSGDPFAGFGGEFGYRTDSETGLLLLGHRYYDPSNGRFVNRDPIGYNGGVNQYNVGTNNPTKNIDPVGFAQLIEDEPGHYVGIFPGHKFINLGQPCNVDGVPVTSIGFYPKGDIWGPGEYLAPEKQLGSGNNSIVDSNNSPDFERNLCKCIQARLAGANFDIDNTINRPDYQYHFPFVQCITSADDLWNCATNKTNDDRKPLPTPWEGLPREVW